MIHSFFESFYWQDTCFLMEFKYHSIWISFRVRKVVSLFLLPPLSFHFPHPTSSLLLLPPFIFSSVYIFQSCPLPSLAWGSEAPLFAMTSLSQSWRVWHLSIWLVELIFNGYNNPMGFAVSFRSKTLHLGLWLSLLGQNFFFKTTVSTVPLCPFPSPWLKYPLINQTEKRSNLVKWLYYK